MVFTISAPHPPQFPVLRFSQATVSMFLPIFLHPALRHLKYLVVLQILFPKKCIIFIRKIDTKCKIPKRGGVVLRHKEKPLALCVLSCFLADGGATAPAHWAGHLGTHTSPGPSLLTSEMTVVFGFRSSLSCCIAFIETTQGPQGTHTWCHGIRGSQPQNGGLLSQPPAVPTKGQAPLCALPGMEDSIIRYELL